MKRVLSLLLCLLLVFGVISVNAQEAAQQMQTINVEYLQIGKYVTWGFPYDDSLFELDPNSYHHTLARATLGLLISAGRDTRFELGKQSERIIKYFTDAGFSDPKAYGYDQPTGRETISCGIAHKKIGDFTLIAIGVCGFGYGKEWAGNFMVGNESRHTGFNIAAQKVEDRIRNYISEHSLEGPLKMWIGGFSRSGAVSNITAADMTDSGIFDSVYAYCFAAPRTTREKGNYQNIYNILGSYDVVPQIPLSDWGYERYGTDLYTPSQESNSDWYSKAIAASAINKQVLGISFRNNPEVDDQLHTVLDYLLDLLPNSAIYETFLQETLCKAMEDGMDEDLLETLSVALENTETSDPNLAGKAKALLSYLETVTYGYLAGNERQRADGSWADDESTSQNLTLEHKFTTYLDWLFSQDDPEKLYSSEVVSYRVLVSGYVDVEVSDADGKVLTLKEDGTLISEAEQTNDSSRPLLFAMRNGTQSIIAIPKDRDYTISVHVNKDENVFYTSSIYHSDSIKRAIGGLHFVKAKTGDVITFQSLAGKENSELQRDVDDTLLNSEEWGIYTPETMTNLENMNVFHLTIGDALVIVFALILVVVLALLIVMICGIRRIILHKRRNFIATLLTNLVLVAVFFLLEGIASALLPTIPAISLAFRMLAVFVLLLLCAKGLTRNRTLLRAPVLAFGILCAIADILLYYLPSLNKWFCYVIYAILVISLLFVSFWRKKKLNISALVVLALSKICMAIALLVELPKWTTALFLAIHYIGMMILAAICWQTDDDDDMSKREVLLPEEE